MCPGLATSIRTWGKGSTEGFPDEEVLWFKGYQESFSPKDIALPLLIGQSGLWSPKSPVKIYYLIKVHWTFCVDFSQTLLCGLGDKINHRELF